MVILLILSYKREVLNACVFLVRIVIDNIFLIFCFNNILFIEISLLPKKCMFPHFNTSKNQVIIQSIKITPQ